MSSCLLVVLADFWVILGWEPMDQDSPQYVAEVELPCSAITAPVRTRRKVRATPQRGAGGGGGGGGGRGWLQRANVIATEPSTKYCRMPVRTFGLSGTPDVSKQTVDASA